MTLPDPTSPSPTTERRAGQQARLVAAAERQIAAGGLVSLKVRALAAETGVALGAVYNLVSDLDDLILRVIGRTLERLDADLAAALDGAAQRPPAAQLEAIACAYHRFALANPSLWRAMFEYQTDKALPDWAVTNQTRLLRHIRGPLAALLPDAGEGEIGRLALTLFGAVHGVVALGLEGRVVGVPASDLEGEVIRLVRLVTAGLRLGEAQP